MKRQVQVFGELAEFRAVGSVPGDYGIEAAQTVDHIVGWEQPQPVKSRCNNGLRGIGEAGERYVLARAPDFGVVRAQRFECRQAEDEIADGACTNQKTGQVNHQL